MDSALIRIIGINWEDEIIHIPFGGTKEEIIKEFNSILKSGISFTDIIDALLSLNKASLVTPYFFVPGEIPTYFIPDEFFDVHYQYIAQIRNKDVRIIGTKTFYTKILPFQCKIESKAKKGHRIFDRLIKKYENKVKDISMYSVPITELNKEELMACVCSLGEIAEDFKKLRYK